MSKPKKVILGLFSIWPIVYLGIFVLFVFSQMLIPQLGPVSTPSPATVASSTSPTSVVANTSVPDWFVALAALHLGTGFLLVILIAIYIRDIFRTNRVAADKKALWAVCIFTLDAKIVRPTSEVATCFEPFRNVAAVAAIQLLMNIPALAQSAAKILLIAREPVKPGAQAQYDRIESETAVLAAELGCPHPYLALQPLRGATNEVWWFNGFDSQDELNSVGEAYKTNEAWNAALTKNQKRKEPLTGKSVEQLADLEPQADSQPWAVGRAQYVVVAINPPAHLGGSTAFKGRDGTRYEILTANTREKAERVARGKDFVVLEVVPRWSFPARDWVAGNRKLWKTTSK